MRYAVCLLAAILLPLAGASTFEQVKRDGQLRLAMSKDNPPFAYYKNGKPSGFEVELVENMAKRLHLKLSWSRADYDTMLVDLNKNRYDVAIGGQFITVARQKQADFTYALYCAGGSLVAREAIPLDGGMGVNTQKALGGKRIGVQNATDYMNYARIQPFKKTILVYPDNNTAIYALITKNVDVVVMNRLGAARAQQDYPKAGLQISPTIWKERVGFALAKDNEDLKDALDDAFDDLLNDGTFDDIATKYFGLTNARC